MEVYIVVNEALYTNSSYYNVVDIFKNKEDAIICIETNVKDLIYNNPFNEEIKVYYDNEIEEQDFNCSEGALLLTPNGYYELFRIEIKTIK